MVTALLILLAAAVLGRDWVLERLRVLAESGQLPKVDARHAIAAALLVAAAVSWSWRSQPADEPTPAPEAGPLVLAGKFVGPSAAADAVALAGLCDEMAACIEYDAGKPEPRLTTGVAMDDMRTAARDGRMQGSSIGDRHPLVRDAVQAYMDAAVGTAGGPLTPEQKSKWVAALRTVARAAEAAVR